jgi:MYXO-CTERM domain-containing protein
VRLLLLTVPLLLLPLARAGTGGPDEGAMVYTDSLEAEGPSHVWLDATGGDAWPLGDDATVAVDLPFDFTFYGTAYDQVTVSSNGALFFAGATSAAAGLCPGDDPSWIGIAAYWDDLAASTVHTQTFGTYPWRTFVVSWDNVAHATAGGSGRFQVWLMEGRNEAAVVLDDTNFGDPTHDDGATAKVGTNSESGGLPWSCDATFAAGTTAWFGDSDARPARATVYSADLDAPWTGQADFDYAGRRIATGDINGDGTDDLLVGTQDRGPGEVALVYRPDTGDTLDGADATFTGAATSDSFGAALVAADLDGDGRSELVVGAPGSDLPANGSGAVYVWAGGGWSGEQAAGDAAGSWTGSATGRPAAGSALAGGDVDGDGYVDLVVGSPTADDSGSDAGAAYLVLGGALPSAATSLTTAQASFTGTAASDQLGGTVATGDLDGDGAAELLLTATFADGGASNAGNVYVVPGGSYAGANTVASVATCTISTPGAGARLGAALLAADIDGSGALDLLLGAPTEDASHTDAGTVYVFDDLGSACPYTALGADAIISGVAASANVGSTLAAGDLDGDGVDDLVIGAPNMGIGASGGGTAYVFTTAPSGTIDADTADHTLAGSGSAGALTTGLAIARNDDALPTIVASAPYDSVGYASDGAIYQWTYRPDFLDADGDGFVDAAAGGNDCDDADATAFPGGTETAGDSVDGDCDGSVDGEVRVRTRAADFAWDLAALGGGDTETYGFETYGEGDIIGVYGDLTLAGSLSARATVYGTGAVGTRGARLATATPNTLGIAFAGPIDGLALRMLDPDDDFTLVATGASGAVVGGYMFALSADDRTGGAYRGFVFADEVTAVTLTGATSDGFGIDALEIAWATTSDRDGDGYSDADGDCDDADATISPAATEDLSDGVDNDCDGVVDAGSATAYTSATDWSTAAGITPEVIDFEDIGLSEIVRSQYTDLGIAFDGTPRGSGNVDGTRAHGAIAARIAGTTTTFRFTEEQPAIGLYLLDGDVAFTVEAAQDGVTLYTTTVTPSSGDSFYGLVFDVPVDSLTITATDTWGIDDVAFSALGLDDADGDGFTELEGDCDDTDATAYTGATETWYDGVDADCAGDDDYDYDRDGSDYPADCGDTDATVNPAATDTWYDGVDSNCDGASDYDADGDGHDDLAWGGDDCDDTDAAVSPDATEVWYDDVDEDCAGDDDFDADGDGFPIDGSLGSSDCDDTDAAVSPDAAEIFYDGVDGDCSGSDESDFDADGDGHDATAWGGDDCADSEPTAYPGATGEACYDGVDTDCDGGDDNDCDHDGYAWDGAGGDDCDDTDTFINPAAVDTLGDGIDSNCDGGPEYDFDGDGYDGLANGGTDCDDTDPAVSPGVVETCYNGVDNDCDGWDDDDCDRDGYAADLYGGADCDDSTATIHPDATDFPYDGVDNDCDGGSEYDIDADGHTSSWYGGDDCDDRDATVYPGATESCYDGVDSDCGGEDDDDCDGDGYAIDGGGGADCDDTDAAINPGAIEIVSDGIDQDCDGVDATVGGCTDCDGDGFDETADCDDTDAAVYPGAADAWYDGVDSACDGGDDFDADGDGADAIAWGGGDCDDADPDVSPANTVDACGGGDEDCDGTVDEDCDFGGDDTGPVVDTDTDVIVDTATRDTADDWRPDPDDLVEPDLVDQDSGCGCATPGTPGTGAAAGALLAGLALLRRRSRR